MSDQNAAAGTPPNDAGNANADGQLPNTPAGADGQAAGTNEPEGQKPAEPAVPESYDLQMPEGVELDTAAADEFKEVAKELKLSQENAQKLADVAAKMAQRQAEQHANLVMGWVEQAKTDKEFGGDKFDENLGVAKKALDQFGTPELRDVLNSTGLTNHPAMIRAFYRIGKAISQDGFVPGTAGGAEKDPAKVMFPTM